MGKLHKLRRAIEREPKKYISYGRATGAGVSWRGHWESRGSFNRQYQAFVRSVLRSRGYNVK